MLLILFSSQSKICFPIHISLARRFDLIYFLLLSSSSFRFRTEFFRCVNITQPPTPPRSRTLLIKQGPACHLQLCISTNDVYNQIRRKISNRNEKSSLCDVRMEDDDEKGPTQNISRHENKSRCVFFTHSSYRIRRNEQRVASENVG